MIQGPPPSTGLTLNQMLTLIISGLGAVVLPLVFWLRSRHKKESSRER
jgi:Mn2+/Fe2+ NRAMP family transporter